MRILSRLKIGGGKIAAIVAIVALAALDASLLQKNRSLNSEIVSGEYSQQPPIGNIMPPLRGVDLSGRLDTVGYNNGQAATFIFVFAARCEFCSQSWPLWLRIVNAADPHRFRSVFVSLDNSTIPPSATATLKSDYTVFTHPDPNDIAAFNLRLTPEVIEVSPKGRLVSAWLGVLDSNSAVGLSKAIGIANFSPNPAANGAPLPGSPRAPPLPGSLP